MTRIPSIWWFSDTAAACWRPRADFLNNEHDAQDAVQEAFASAFRALDKFNGDAMLYTWLHRIVVNAALVQLRFKRHRGEQPIEALLPRLDHEGESIDDPATWT